MKKGEVSYLDAVDRIEEVIVELKNIAPSKRAKKLKEVLPNVQAFVLAHTAVRNGERTNLPGSNFGISAPIDIVVSAESACFL